MYNGLFMHLLSSVTDKDTSYKAVVMQDCIVQEKLLGSVSKPGRRRQRERQQAKGLMSKAMAVHVRYKSLYIFAVL